MANSIADFKGANLIYEKYRPSGDGANNIKNSSTNKHGDSQRVSWEKGHAAEDFGQRPESQGLGFRIKNE
jgi:hypothetical protein